MTQRKQGQEGRHDIEWLKKLVIIAMFSDDELMDQLVLKGGNALDLIHGISARASVDVDFSMADDFPGGLDALRSRVERALAATFEEAGYRVFDVNVNERPKVTSPELRSFWGGYRIEFKIIERARYDANAGDVESLRRAALELGTGAKFFIDVSRYEYTEGKQPRDLDGYRIFVYSLSMIVCEKVRAVCQQMPEYGAIVKRARPAASRARDFVDIYFLAENLKFTFEDPANQELIRHIFFAKRVPLQLVRKIAEYRDFHRADFAAVQATVKPDIALSDFDFYFEYVLSLVKPLEALGDV